MTTPAEKAAGSIRLLFFDTNEAVYCFLVAYHAQVVAAIQNAIDDALAEAQAWRPLPAPPKEEAR